MHKKQIVATRYQHTAHALNKVKKNYWVAHEIEAEKISYGAVSIKDSGSRAEHN